MKDYTNIGNLQVSTILLDFINNKVLPETGLSGEKFWADFQSLVEELAPENKALLARRNQIQEQVNQWHREQNDNFEFARYKAFLQQIGYLEEEVEDFEIVTENVDDEISVQAGPQLVVPVNNARYALNAANARWGSLYDALYGTDVISQEAGLEPGSTYNSLRGEKVISFGRQFLNGALPLKDGSHEEVIQYSIQDDQLYVLLADGSTTSLVHTNKLVGFQGEKQTPKALLFVNNGLHIEIQIDPAHPIGAQDKAGVKDIVLESALTAIMDFEDSVAAVDAEDKVEVYRNWLGLIKGDLEASFQKGSKTVARTLNQDREYENLTGASMHLSGRALLFVRNVGHLMTNNAIFYGEGQEIPEGILDGVITALISKHDVLQNGKYQNSKKGSIYIVKPKMHGSEEVAFANKLFNRIEDMLELERNTLKIGVMDEERRTSLNLKNCIYQVRERLVFINTGFLDRTGDEMHTSMEAGAMIRKNDMKSTPWLQAYEKSNVVVGVGAKLPGRAQIGKGMWAMPDLMAEMVKQKIGHLQAGANTAWVPSPTAATLHALHYHQVNVGEIQASFTNITEDYKDAILTFPVSETKNWSAKEIQEELDNNAQGILGYVVRWVEQGVGCSKVPDINNVGLMEDRATLRISSQHMTNWLYHGICSEAQVLETLKRMAKVVDEQNASDPNYRPMSVDFESSVAFQAACELVFEGRNQPSGYTEPILHRRRIEAKAKQKVEAAQ